MDVLGDKCMEPNRRYTADSKQCALTAVFKSVEWNVLSDECVDPIRSYTAD